MPEVSAILANHQGGRATQRCHMWDSGGYGSPSPAENSTLSTGEYEAASATVNNCATLTVSMYSEDDFQAHFQMRQSTFQVNLAPLFFKTFDCSDC